jgi:Holliday junction resolvasome RuvABC endonuclease subunit
VSKRTRRYLSLDTSLTKSGWAIISVTDSKASIVDYGLIRSHTEIRELDGKKRKQSDGERLRQIHGGLLVILAKYSDIERVIPREEGIVRFNIPTRQIFKAHGMTEFSLSDYTLADVNIQTVKAWARRVTGSDGKRKDKEMIAEAVRIYFDWPTAVFPSDDVTDAIAVGIVYLLREGIVE